jgi:hypothetical protein
MFWHTEKMRERFTLPQVNLGLDRCL